MATRKTPTPKKKAVKKVVRKPAAKKRGPYKKPVAEYSETPSPPAEEAAPTYVSIFPRVEVIDLRELSPVLRFPLFVALSQEGFLNRLGLSDLITDEQSLTAGLFLAEAVNVDHQHKLST